MAGDRAKAKGAYQDFLNLVVYLANCFVTGEPILPVIALRK